MSTALASPHAGVDIVTNTDPFLGPIVVATDGTTSANSALKAAAQLAESSGATVSVLSVLEPLPMVAADYGLLLPPADTDAARRDALAQRVRDQIVEVVGPRPNWSVQVLDGDPAAVIARAGRESGARVLVLGIGHHDLLDRMFGGETALHTLRLSRIPVLAVAPNFAKLPERIAIAIDFSEPSILSARAALALLPTVSFVYLVHVAPRLELQPEAFAAWMTDYSGGVEPAFERVKARLALRPGVTVETMTLTGKPTRALLDFAKSAHIDTLVTGSRGAGLVDRILVGSTATGLIRGAHCSVFAVPAPMAVTPPRGPGASPDEIPEHEWAAALEAFTRRNAGRLATLEVDDPEIGAQAQQHDYPFIGAAYDRHDRRIELMIGEMENSTRHLTRGIGDVRHLDLVKDATGRDWALRIAHGSGQTILTLAR
jgi:nucleotide-binding universal stress UspA family protein